MTIEMEPLPKTKLLCYNCIKGGDDMQNEHKETAADATVIARDEEYWKNWTPGIANPVERLSTPTTL